MQTWSTRSASSSLLTEEEKTELIYRLPCKNCFSSETGRKLGLRIKEHNKEVDSFTARESRVTHKSAITDHAVEENHVIDWDKANVIDREAQWQTRWIKEALWIRKTPTRMNQDAGSYRLSHTCDHQVISRSRAPSRCKQSRRDQDVRRTVIIRYWLYQLRAGLTMPFKPWHRAPRCQGAPRPSAKFFLSHNVL